MAETEQVTGTREAGARNLLPVWFTGMGCLASVLLYLAWNSFSSAAPAVLRQQTARSGDPRVDRQIRDHRPEVARAKEQFWEAQQQPAAGKRLSDLQIIKRGQLLYRCAGCVRCHGPHGKGGVTNPNYIDDTFPRLDEMAAMLSLAFPEDVEEVVDLLSAGTSLNDPAMIDVRKAGVVAAKYRFIVDTIANGSRAGKKDPQEPEPTDMPPFKDVLTRSEINQLLAYFLVLYPVDEEE